MNNRDVKVDFSPFQAGLAGTFPAHIIEYKVGEKNANGGYPVSFLFMFEDLPGITGTNASGEEVPAEHLKGTTAGLRTWLNTEGVGSNPPNNNRFAKILESLELLEEPGILSLPNEEEVLGMPVLIRQAFKKKRERNQSGEWITTENLFLEVSEVQKREGEFLSFDVEKSAF